MSHIRQAGTFLALSLSFSMTLQAQSTGDCRHGEAEAYLNVGNVRARLFNSGNLFWRGNPPVYEVPIGSGLNALFNANLWIGGWVQDTLHFAGTLYGPNEFWPGPLDDQGNPPSDCAIYDRLFEITREDIESYNQSGSATDNLNAWPWSWGAPVLDGDGIPDNYNLEGGDRPALVGDQLVWWVMNDRGNVHRFYDASHGEPLGVEVQASAFAFAHPGYLGNTTFYRYRLRYQGQAPLQAAYFGVFIDAKIGYFRDDFVGSDTTLSLGFSYNADNDDEGFYGAAPPAVGTIFLTSPTVAADSAKAMPSTLYSFVRINSGAGGAFDSPQDAYQMYYRMEGLTNYGQPITYGGYGRDFSSTPTRYMFPGDPVTRAFWSELNLDSLQTVAEEGDRRHVVTTGPFTMNPGDVDEVTFAIVWSRGSDHLDSVRQLKQDVTQLRDVASELLRPRMDLRPPSPAPPDVLVFAQNYPNPFTGTTTIGYSLPQAMQVRLVVYDVLGREVATLVNARQESGRYEVDFEAADLSMGVYYYRIELDHLRFTKTMILVR